MLRRKLIKFLSLTLAFVTAVSPMCITNTYATEVGAVMSLTEEDIETAAEYELTFSDEGLAVLKKMEGFAKYPYYDYGQYSVGYGTFCPTADLERYRQDGITDKEAEELLKSYLVKLEKTFDAFLDRNNLDLPQNQYDALVLFSYNCGTSWMINSTGIRSAVLNRKKNYEVIYEFSRWCNAGGQMLTSLIKRRLAEANLYLNGVYNSVGPSDYYYVRFDANGGSCGVRIQGYDIDEMATIKPVAKHNDYTFAGWSTSTTSNKLITTLDGTLKDKTVLYARWNDGTEYENADSPEKPKVDKTELENSIKMTKELVESEYTPETWLAVKDALSAAESGMSNKDIEQSTVDALIKTLSDAVNALTKAEVKDETSDSETSDTETPKDDEAGDVTKPEGDGNKEETPSEPPKEEGKEPEKQPETKPEEKPKDPPKEEKPKEEKPVEKPKEDDKKDDEKDEEKNDNSSSNKVNKTVKITATSLNVRKGPGTKYDKVTYLMMGNEVVITETKDVDGTLWGKYNKGWISLAYTNYELEEQLSKPSTSTSNKDVLSSSGMPARIADCTSLRIRSGAGKVFGTIGYYKVGDKVSIYEQATYEGDVWGKTDRGWVSMRYVKLDDSSSSNSNSNNSNSSSSSNNSQAKYQTGRIAYCTTLNVRKAPGTHNARANIIGAGTKVKIYETTYVNDIKWGRIDQGWISLSYVKLDGESNSNTTSNDTNNSSSSNSSSSTSNSVMATGTIVNCMSLSVREDAGTQYERVGYVKVGDKVKIYEQKYANDKVWGRIDKGWISLNYVKLEETEFQGVVTTNGLRIRKEAGLGKLAVGAYNAGQVVTIIDMKYVDGMNWGKTDKGWISMNYIEKK